MGKAVIVSGLLKFSLTLLCFYTQFAIASTLSTIDDKAYCQKIDFGFRQNLNNILIASRLKVHDPSEQIPIYILSALSELVSKIQLSHVKEISLSADDGHLYLDASMFDEIQMKRFDFWKNKYCEKKEPQRPSGLSLLEQKTINSLILLLYTQKELVSNLKHHWGIEAQTKETNLYHRFESSFSPKDLAHLWSRILLFPPKFIGKLNIKYLSRLNKGLELKDNTCCEFIYNDRTLRISDRFFTSSTPIEFYRLLGEILWSNLSEVDREKYKEVALPHTKKPLPVPRRGQATLQNDFAINFESYLSVPDYLEQRSPEKFKFIANFFGNKRDLHVVAYNIFKDFSEKQQHRSYYYDFTIKSEGEFQVVKWVLPNPVKRPLADELKVQLKFVNNNITFDKEVIFSSENKIQLSWITKDFKQDFKKEIELLILDGKRVVYRGKFKRTSQDL